MPNIDDVLKKKKKKFVKKEFRSWNMDELMTAPKDDDRGEGVSKTPETSIRENADIIENCTPEKKASPIVEVLVEKNVDILSKDVIQEKVEYTAKEKYLAQSKAVLSQTSNNEVVSTHEESHSPEVKENLLGQTKKEELMVLMGLQKLLFEHLLEKVDTETFNTLPLNAKELTEKLKTTYAVTKNTIKKLEKRGLIVNLSRRGRGGFFKFHIEPELYNFARRYYRQN